MRIGATLGDGPQGGVAAETRIWRAPGEGKRGMGQRTAVISRQGFLAGHLVDQLGRAGFDVAMVDPSDYHCSPERRPHARQREVGARLGLAGLQHVLEGCDCVHYLGLQYGEQLSRTPSPKNGERARACATAACAVLRAARQAGVRRIVVAATCRTRCSREGQAVDEDGPLHTGKSSRDPVVRSLAVEEKKIVDFAQGAGLATVMILSGDTIGPRDAGPSRLGSALVQRLNGESTSSFGVEGTFPVADVRDAARAHVAAARMESPAPAYLVVAQTVGAREWSELFSRTAGLPTADRMLRASLAMPMAYAMEAVEQVTGVRAWLRRDALRQIREPHQYDCSRVQRELGLRFTPLETSIRDAVGWYARNGWIADEARLAIVRSALARAAYDASLHNALRSAGAAAAR